MALRLIETLINGNNTAKVYRDAEWQEYRVKFWQNGFRQPERTDYHTDDKQDAIGTAKEMIGVKS